MQTRTISTTRVTELVSIARLAMMVKRLRASNKRQLQQQSGRGAGLFVGLQRDRGSFTRDDDPVVQTRLLVNLSGRINKWQAAQVVQQAEADQQVCGSQARNPSVGSRTFELFSSL